MAVDWTKPPQPPKRCYTISVEIGADTFEEAVAELERLTDHIGDHGAQCNLVMGGVSSGSSVVIVHRPEMTHDRYVEQLNQYLNQRKGR